jgi:DNA processing protein
MSITHDTALVFSPHWSPRIAREVAQNFPDRSRVFTTSREELLDRLPTHPQWVEDFLLWKKKGSCEFYEEMVRKEGLEVLAQEDARYPALLKEIHDPPMVLFVKGNIPSATSWCAVVGSREATAYGKSQAFRFGKELAEQNIGVVSGLAYGIDEHAIRGACSANGAIIAVLAGGHPCIGAREKELGDLIIANNGAVISECVPHVQPLNYFFPVRNRIIAGIAKRTLVVEGKVKSGSLVTAQKALEENREVFAVPGPITSTASGGCHRLIREGATLCTSIYDILDIPHPEECTTPKGSKKSNPPHLPSAQLPHLKTPLHEKLWAFLQQPRMFDSLVEYAQEKGAEVAGILNIWEIEGYLALKNGHYSLIPYEHPPHC